MYIPVGKNKNTFGVGSCQRGYTYYIHIYHIKTEKENRIKLVSSDVIRPLYPTPFY